MYKITPHIGGMIYDEVAYTFSRDVAESQAKDKITLGFANRVTISSKGEHESELIDVTSRGRRFVLKRYVYPNKDTFRLRYRRLSMGIREGLYWGFPICCILQWSFEIAFTKKLMGQERGAIRNTRPDGSLSTHVPCSLCHLRGGKKMVGWKAHTDPIIEDN